MRGFCFLKYILYYNSLQHSIQGILRKKMHVGQNPNLKIIARIVSAKPPLGSLTELGVFSEYLDQLIYLVYSIFLR